MNVRYELWLKGGPFVRYYIVTCICGHVGAHYGRLTNFAVKAESKRGAAKIARDIPRVKHHHKEAIKEVREVSCEEYEHQAMLNMQDGFLKSKNRRESFMNGFDFSERQSLESITTIIRRESRKKNNTDGRYNFYGKSEKAYVNRYQARETNYSEGFY